MSDKSKMLAAHVQFELDRWTGAALEETVEQEVAALVAWFASVRLVDVVHPQQVEDWIQRFIVETPVSDELARSVDDLLRLAHTALLHEQTPLNQLLPQQAYAQIIEAAARMREVRQEVTAQITTSSVYSRLIAHVLYHGIKSYVLTQNVVARRVPGAASLLRLGQNALSSAAPNLERSLDKQLVAFINANVQDSIRESKRYLDTVLDEQMMTVIGDEIWAMNADKTVGQLAGLVSNSALGSAVAAGRDAWLHLRRSPVILDVAVLLVQEFFRAHGDTSVAVLLDRFGITHQVIAREVHSAAAPLVEKARESGYLEARIRDRLDAFYSAYWAEADKPRQARKHPSAEPQAE